MGLRHKYALIIPLAGCLSGLWTGMTLAANVSPVGLTVMPGLGALQWDIENDGASDTTAFAGTCKSKPGLTINDAVDANGDLDAYDTAYTLYVDGVPFIAPDPSDLTGTTFTAGPLNMSGLNVTVEYFFPATLQAARIRVILENPTGFANLTDIDVPVNLGSDASTVIEATASGDLLYTTADRWIITSDGIPAKPVNTTVVYGPGAVNEIPASTTVGVCGDPDPTGVGFSFNFTVPANATRQLMFFAGLGDIKGPGNTTAGAITNVTMFDANNTIDPALLADIPVGDLGEILNWALAGGGGGGGGGGCSLTTRDNSDPTLWVLMLIAAVCVRRRRSRKLLGAWHPQLLIGTTGPSCSLGGCPGMASPRGAGPARLTYQGQAGLSYIFANSTIPSGGRVNRLIRSIERTAIAARSFPVPVRANDCNRLSSACPPL